ncbi:MAG: hypothetical protein JW789_03820 [Candidatus Aenigmarchaeota archaeon]|nr:hypothetical protein [Candidatus Aenigmarchaeota archaeon]
MKGLSMTLSIVIVAIVLLVTALVVLTIFGGQMSRFLSIFGGVQDEAVLQSACNQRCASYCMGHLNDNLNAYSWTSMGSVKDANGKDALCSDVMNGISDQCTCL